MQLCFDNINGSVYIASQVCLLFLKSISIQREKNNTKFRQRNTEVNDLRETVAAWLSNRDREIIYQEPTYSIGEILGGGGGDEETATNKSTMKI